MSELGFVLGLFCMSVHVSELGFVLGLFCREVSAERGKWQSYNLLAFMKARGEEVTKQLAALEARD